MITTTWKQGVAARWPCRPAHELCVDEAGAASSPGEPHPIVPPGAAIPSCCNNSGRQQSKRLGLCAASIVTHTRRIAR